MKYLYYPGCSLEGTAVEYDASTRAVLQALGMEVLELDDWTCCGASAADAMSYLLSMTLPARNLALAERMNSGADLLVPCSACYLNLAKVQDHTRRDGQLLDNINTALQVEGLSYRGGVRVRHLLDVVANDIGAATIAAKVQRKLTGLRVAPYYGCQALRPYGSFDDPEQPKSMEPLIAALGAQVHTWSMGAKCCGAGLMTTKKDVALRSVTNLLQAAQGADCILTVCPMCQMNLDSFQSAASRLAGADLSISVLYLPQLMGLALGIPADRLKLTSNMALSTSLLGRLH